MRIRISDESPRPYHIRSRGRLETSGLWPTHGRKVAHTVRTAHNMPDQTDFEIAAHRARNYGVASRIGQTTLEFKIEPVLRVDKLVLHVGSISVFRTVDKVPFELHPAGDLPLHVEPLPMLPDQPFPITESARA